MYALSLIGGFQSSITFDPICLILAQLALLLEPCSSVRLPLHLPHRPPPDPIERRSSTALHLYRLAYCFQLLVEEGRKCQSVLGPASPASIWHVKALLGSSVVRVTTVDVTALQKPDDSMDHEHPLGMHCQSN